MRAIALSRYGGPEVLEQVERPTPSYGSDEILVRVTACGVCGHDLLARRGKLGTPLPRVIGHEIAGRVEAVGADVSSLRRGQRVALIQRVPCGQCPDCAAGLTNMCRRGAFYGEDIDGGYAELVVATERNAVRLPDEIDDTTGAILSCGVGTALHALRRAAVDSSDVVVVAGAGGGVGVHAVQLAVHAGATVLAWTSSPAKAAMLTDLGAHEVVVGRDVARAREALKALGGRRGASVVIETVGPPTFEASLRLLAPQGRLVLLGNTEPASIPLEPGLTIVKELSVIGSAHATMQDLEDVVQLVQSGAVRPVATRTWPLEQAAEAHRALEDREVAGRAVLAPIGEAT